MDKLIEIKNQYLNGDLSPLKLYHAAKPFYEILHSLYPNVGNLMSCIYLYVNELPEEMSFCKIGSTNRRLKSINSGFMQFCGNQSSCQCNKENSKQHLESRTSEHKEEITKKRISTNIEKYGVEFASKLDDIKIKTAATCISKYGAKSPTKNPEILAKVRNTLLENYGVEFPHQNIELAKKAENTWLETRGVSRPAKDPTVIKTMQDTMFDKYGVTHNMKIPEIRNAVRIKNRTRLFNTVLQARPSATPIFTVADFILGDSNTEWKWKCINCASEFNQALRPGNDVKCVICNPLSESWGETMIRKWLTSNNITYNQNIRSIISPLELDFYIPELKIAIEFNGIYWHSEQILDDKLYHFNKFKACHDQGIKLIQVWEQDLLSNPLIVFSRLSHILNIPVDKIIGARKCNITDITAHQARMFLNEYHLQGFHPSGRYFGAWHNEELIGVSTIGKSRYTNSADYELTRFAIKSNISAPGILSKMLSNYKKIAGSVRLVSYSDLSWGYGYSYQQQGFTFSHFTKPNYFYFKNVKDIKSRIAFQKHKINKLGISGTETEIAASLGYNRFFDAGNSVWLKTL